MSSLRIFGSSLLVVASIALGTACGDSGTGGGNVGGEGGTASNGGNAPEGGGGSNPTTGGGDVGGEGGSGGGFMMGGCNDLANVGADVPETSLPDAAAPPMTGGPITDGTYALTTVVVYAGAQPGPTTIKETLMLAGGSIASVNSTNGGPETTGSGTYATADNILTFTFDCPAEVELQSQYTSDGASVSIINAAGNRVSTYTLQ
ncbi:MAG: hypothetical protein HOW73_05270 [Polyangiaceae bacterium]|nr:hypothetical protein [Polyangiaceae bacterium]